jgi:hypothetical protein
MVVDAGRILLEPLRLCILYPHCFTQFADLQRVGGGTGRRATEPPDGNDVDGQ